MKKSIVIIVAVAALGFVRVSTAHAAWGDLYCDIVNGSAGGFNKALELYHDPDEINRECKYGIRFRNPQTLVLPSGFTIDRTPPSGQEHGFSIRKCRGPGQSYPDAGCPAMSNTDVVIDVSGTGGDCPIKVYNGSKISIFQLKIIATNPAKAVCTSNGTPIQPEQQESPHAYLHDVTIVSPTGQLPDSDGDGVPDPDDDCADTPAGTDVDENGCPVVDDDDDNDGVPNDQDNCPNTPAGTNVDEHGCPIVTDPDSDDDGVCDGPTAAAGICTAGSDECANTPADTPVDAKGCPTTTPGDDQDGDDVLNGPDKCDHDSTGDACDSLNLVACFANSVDNVCNGAVVGSSIACSELEDMDNDGVGNRCDSDIDGDTLPNGSDPDPYDKDADNDGVNDNLDQCPLNNQRSTTPCNPTPVTPTDTDPDGDGVITNFPGEDKNKNGVYDVGSETDPINPDTDGDGSKDGADCFPLDAAKQACGGTTIVIDPDSDNDGICDSAVTGTDPATGETICTPNALLGSGDNCSLVPNPDQADADADGEGDACEQTTVINVEGDTDGDGLSDDLEDSVFHTDKALPDTDGDGLSDGDEVFGMTYQGGSGPLNPDVDFDGICDGPIAVTQVPETCPDGKTDDEEGCDTSEFTEEICNAGPAGKGDNCPIVENPGQENDEADGVGNACQGDTDADGVPDVGNKETPGDNCPFMKNEDQKDTDGDGNGDECEVFNPSISALGPEGCGCRIDGASTSSVQSALPFLAMLLPMAMFRIVRKRKLMS